MDPGPRPAGRAIPALLVALGAFAAQVPGLRRVLVWDDIFLFARDDLYVNASRLAEALTSPLGKETPYWRPVATTSFLAESLVHGGVAEGFRTTAALLHAAAAAIAFLLVERITRHRGVAALAALAFAWHPANAETVTWISGRFDLLAGLLTLGALCVAGDGGGGRMRAAGLAVLCAAAAMTKESAVVLPAIALLWAVGVASPPPGEAVRSLWARRGVAIAGAVGLAAALLLRFEAVGWLPPAPGAAGGPWDRATAVGRSFATALYAIAWPWQGVAPVHHPPRLVGGFDLYGAVGLLFLAVAVLLVVVHVRRSPRRGLLGAAFLVSLLPTSQVVPVAFSGGADLADRFLYVPTFLAVALLADVAASDLVARALRPGRAAVAGGVVLAALVGYRTWVVTRWNEPVALWEWAVAKAPRSAYAREQLAVAHMNAGELDAAEAAMRAAPDGSARLLAEILVLKGRTADAVAALDRGLAVNPADVEARYLRGELRLRGGEPAGALADFVRVAADETARPRYEPLRPAALAGASHAASLLGREDEAAAHLRQAMAEAADSDQRAWLVIAGASFVAGRLHDGLDAAQKALRAGADEEQVLRAEVAGLRVAARPAEVVPRLQRLAALRPGDPAVLDDLGYALWEAGDREGAEKTLRAALAGDAGFAWARFHLAVLLARTGRAEESGRELGRARADAASRGDAELLRRIEAHEAEGRPRPGR